MMAVMEGRNSVSVVTEVMGCRSSVMIMTEVRAVMTQSGESDSDSQLQ